MLRLGVLIVSLFFIWSTQSSWADSVADFYRGKAVNMLIPSGVGGGYDLYARFLARYLSNYLPGRPNVVVRNMPGAGGILEANYLSNSTAPDGLTFGELQYTLTLNQLVKTPSIKYDMRKFSWIGSIDTSSTICIVSGKAKNLTGRNLLNSEVLIGGSGGSTVMIPLLLNSLADGHFKLVHGYESTSNVVLAMQNSEVNGLCGWSWDGARVIAKQMLQRGTAKIGLDIGSQPQAELKAMGVPFLMDLVPSGEKKTVLNLLLSPQVYSRPFAMPHGVPPERVAAFQEAFRRALSDPKLQQDAKRQGIQLDYLPGQKLLQLINSVFEAPVAIQKRAADELQKAGFKS